MAVDEDALQAIQRGDKHVREVLDTFRRVLKLSEEELGNQVRPRMSQTQVHRRLTVPGSLNTPDLLAFAAFFQVEPATFYKPLREALSDLPIREESKSRELADAVA